MDEADDVLAHKAFPVALGGSCTPQTDPNGCEARPSGAPMGAIYPTRRHRPLVGAMLHEQATSSRCSCVRWPLEPEGLSASQGLDQWLRPTSGHDWSSYQHQ